jgi:hypothetical protein
MREQSEDCSVFWVDASTENSIEQSYNAIAGEFGDLLGWTGSISSRVQLFLRHLTWTFNGRWLVVLDGLQPQTALYLSFKNLLPQGLKGSLLFTALDPTCLALLNPVKTIQVPKLDDETIQLFKMSPEDNRRLEEKVEQFTEGLSTNYIRSFDGEKPDGFAEFMDNSNEYCVFSIHAPDLMLIIHRAKWADKWMLNLKTKVHDRKPQRSVRYKDSPLVKIAVLDTGIDMQHNYIKGCRNANRIKGVKSFVTDDQRIDDVCGHGTHVAALLLKVAPECQIYIAKVASGSEIPTNHNIAEVSL